MAVPSLPPPRPKSPPVYPDLYGKRRELAKVQMLEREIGFLQEELKSIEGLQHASHCCKEIAEFTDANSDPFIPTKQKVRNSCRFWKWLCGRSCFNVSWACCFGCSPLKMPRCCTCNLRDCTCNVRYCPCTIPKCSCCSWPGYRCFKNFSCRRICCLFQCRPSCPDCSCTKWKCCFPKCPKVHLRSCCTENCCTENCCYRYCLCC